MQDKETDSNRWLVCPHRHSDPAVREVKYSVFTALMLGAQTQSKWMENVKMSTISPLPYLSILHLLFPFTHTQIGIGFFNIFLQLRVESKTQFYPYDHAHPAVRSANIRSNFLYKNMLNTVHFSLPRRAGKYKICIVGREKININIFLYCL